jgi:oligopeptide/dipeptide ABC transporter ATP-binding protein
MTPTLLEIHHVSKAFSSGFFNDRRQMAVDEVTFSLPEGAPLTVALAGESGSGKTTLAQMILGFLPPTSGRISFQGQDVYRRRGQAADLLGYFHHVQAVFQNPYEAFNPFYSIDHIFSLTIAHFTLARGRKASRVVRDEVLRAVQLDPGEIGGRYPHQLSGGQLQRLMIARALLLKPKLLVADEPVSMVDVSLRVMLLDLLNDLKTRYGISLIYITHDLSTALQISDEILIMYRGSLVEAGEASMVIQNPAHPYTQLLVRSIPLPDPAHKWSKSLEVDDESEGWTPSDDPTSSCKFLSRCPHRMQICRSKRPELVTVREQQRAACFLIE